ncbi:hypothetical protein P7C70_g3923, partial [Phenoliferia sp. Uapishka_3]
MHAFSTVLSIALAASSAVAISINTPSDWTTTGEQFNAYFSGFSSDTSTSQAQIPSPTREPDSPPSRVRRPEASTREVDPLSALRLNRVVNTDPSTFAAILVNQDSNLLSSSIVLEANFSTSNTYFSVTPSSDYNAGSGYQVNFIRNTDSPNTIYAQTNMVNCLRLSLAELPLTRLHRQFNITSGSTSAASTSTGTSTSVKTTTSTGVSTTSTGTSTGTSTSTVDKHNGGDSTSSTASGSSVSATASNRITYLPLLLPAAAKAKMSNASYPPQSPDRDPCDSFLPELYIHEKAELDDLPPILDPDSKQAVAKRHSVNVHRHPLPRAFTIIFGSYLLALICAVAHHIFNSRLHGKEVDSNTELSRVISDTFHGRYTQSEALQVGTSLAWLTHTLAKAAVATAWIQWAWRVVERNSMTVRSIDALFAATSSGGSYKNLGMYKAATFSVFIAATSWTLFVMSLLPPSSLNAITVIVKSPILPSVPTFSPGSPSDMIALAAASQSGDTFAYTSSPLAGRIAGLFFYDPGRLASVFSRAVTTTLASGRPAVAVSPCGSCSFNQTIYAPAFNCSVGFPDEELDDTDIRENAVIWRATTFGNTSFQSPLANRNSLLYKGNLAFQTGSGIGPASNYSCYTYNASYTISSDFSTTPAEITILDRTFVTQYPFFPEAVSLWTDAIGTTTPSFPFLTSEVFSAIAFEAVKDSLYVNLNGSILIYLAGESVTSTNTISVLETDLISSNSTNNVIVWDDSLPEKVEQLMNNVTLSVLTLNLTQATVPAFQVHSQLVFDYNPKILFAPYAYGLFVSAICVALGAIAMFSSGAETRAGFEDFFDATRSTCLDKPELVQGKAKIRYGRMIGEGHANERRGFAMDVDLEPVKEDTHRLRGVL